MYALFYGGRALPVQNGQNRRAKRVEGALAWLLVIKQEMGQFVRQRKTLLFVGIACVNEDHPLAPLGQQASVQASVAPTYAMGDLDAPRPVQDVSDAQGGNRIDLQRQRQDDRHLHITGELTRSTSQYPEPLTRILDKIDTLPMIHPS